MATRNVMIFKGHVFCSPNMTTLPPVIPQYSPSLPFWHAKDFPQTQWGYSAYPFICYVPKSPDYHGPLFERLNITYERAPIQFSKEDGYYRLDSTVQENWIHLEQTLLKAGSILHTIPSPLDFRLYKLPSSHMKFSVRDQQYARKLAMRCRDAFLPLIAYVSFTISIYLRDEQSVENPKWLRHLVSHSDLHPAWLQNLKNSMVADFSIQRAGVIVHTLDCQWLDQIKYPVVANIPVWLYYGTKDHLFSSYDLIFQKYLPTGPEVVRAQYMIDNPPPTPQDAVHEPPSQPTRAQSRKCVNGQQQGETWQEFFSRRATENQRRISRETDKERQARESREKAAQVHPIPGLHGPRVFLWEEDDDGNWVREPILKAAVEGIWDHWPNAQRRFDPCRNEWDICPPLAPDAELDDDDSNSDYYGDDDDGQVVEASESAPPPPESHSVITHNDILSSYSDVVHYEPYPAPELMDMVYLRFGFHYTPTDDGRRLTEDEWTLTSRILGDTVSSIDTRFKHPLKQFVDGFLNGLPVPSLSALMCDLCVTHSSPLTKKLWPSLRIVPLRMPNGQDIYTVQAVEPNLKDVDWMLSVDSPTTALQIYREYHHRELSLGFIARELVSSGISFRTWTPPHTRLPYRPPSRPRPVGLGWRRKGYVPDIADYFAYVAARNDFFQQPHTRAALLHGGLIWRLAVDALGLLPVFDGASHDAIAFGQPLAVRGNVLYDDCLNSDEIDLICGTYRVYTDDSGPQASESSWWPRPSAWSTSGLNTGYWSRGCEQWFKKRLKDIESGGTVKTSGEWKQAMKFRRETRRMMEMTEVAAKLFLAGETFS